MMDRYDPNPFRRASFVFPSVSEKNLPVDVTVEIRPASGLAQISLVPNNPGDAEFLRGRQIFLDFSTMEEADPPPPPTRGWPDVLKFEIDPMSTFIDVCRWKIQNYLQSDPEYSEHSGAVDGIKDVLTWLPNPFNTGVSEKLQPIDQDGISGTPKACRIIDAIAKKAENDFPKILPGYRMTFINRINWLYAKTPENVKNEIRENISQRDFDRRWTYGVEAAGKVFTEKKDFQLLYFHILRRIKSDHPIPFPLQSYKALWRLLSLREGAPMALTPRKAKVFTEEAVKMMEGETLAGNYKHRFFQAARLFLFLLRFRIVAPDFLDPENYLDSDLFERTLSLGFSFGRHTKSREALVRGHRAH